MTLDDIVERFEDAWERGERPEVAAFLPLNGARASVLVELVHVDLERRLKAGEDVRVEGYLQQFPELSDASILGELAAAEFSLRRRRDPHLTPDELGRRFPQLSAAFVGRTFTMAPGANGDSTSPSGHGPVETRADYDELRPHAHGGLGEVFVAHDVALGREVALKFLRLGAARDRGNRERFRHEAEITGRLEHPGVVPVYGVGRDIHGEPVYAMRFVRGQTLQHSIDHFHAAAPTLSGGERRVAFRQLVTRLLSVCHTIAFAHSRGVIHRDVKPGNILLGEFGETLVVDWGLALECSTSGEPPADGEPPAEIGEPPAVRPRVLGARKTRGLTAGGSPDVLRSALQGTPAYMAPEQAVGREVGPAVDVFGLGAMLYALLTGRAPYVDGLREVIERARIGDFVAPRQVNRGAPRALEAVCLKAMNVDPTLRYSAMDLARDLERWLAGEPVSAWREPLALRAKRWVSRHITLVTSVVIVTIATTILIGVSAVLHADKRLVELQRETDRKELARRMRDDYSHRIALAGRAWFQGNRPSVALQLDACPQPWRRWEWDHLKCCLDYPPVEIGRHALEAWAVVYSPDGTRLASAGLDGAVHFYDLKKPGSKPRSLPKNDKPVWAVAFHPDGLRLATAGDDFIVRVWDLDTLTEIQSFEMQGEIHGVAFSRDGKRLAACTVPGLAIGRPRQGVAAVWDLASGKKLVELGGHANGVHAVTFAPDGRLVTAGMDGLVKLWNLNTRKADQFFRGHRFRVYQVAVSPDGARLASASGDGSIGVWDMATGQRLHTLLGHREQVWGVAFSPDGSRVISSSDDRTIRVWDAARGRLLRTLRGHAGGIANIAVRPDGRQLASAGDDQTVRLWPLDSPAECDVFTGHDGPVNAVAINGDGSLFAGAGDDRRVRVVDAANLRELDSTRLDMPATAVAFQPGAPIVALAGIDGVVRLRDVRERRDLRSWPAHRAAIWAVAFSPDGKVLATASEDMTVTLWNRLDGCRVRSFETKGQVRCIAFSRDGRWLAAGGDDKLVRVWNASTGELRHELNGPTSGVRCVAFSPNGATLVAGTDRTSRVVTGEPGQLRFYDLATGEERDVVAGHVNGVSGVAFTPDGERLLSVGGDGALKVWDAAGQELMMLQGHLRPATSVAIGGDGRVVTGGQDGNVIVWRGDE